MPVTPTADRHGPGLRVDGLFGGPHYIGPAGARLLLRGYQVAELLVLDPFAGSGTTGAAALNEGLEFVGIERDPKYAEIARGRLATCERSPPLVSYFREAEV